MVSDSAVGLPVRNVEVSGRQFERPIPVRSELDVVCVFPCDVDRDVRVARDARFIRAFHLRIVYRLQHERNMRRVLARVCARGTEPEPTC